MAGTARAAPPQHRTGNVIRDSALGRVPATVEDIIALNRHVWDNGYVGPALLEILRLRNARTVDCVYCRAVRYGEARRDGLTEERAAMVADGYEASVLAAREKTAIALADAYLGFPAGVSRELAARVAAGFSPAEIASMLVALMTFHFTSRTAVAIGGMPEAPLPIVEISVAATTGGPVP
jgi:alkylhydroperoxidase family enzyme